MSLSNPRDLPVSFLPPLLSPPVFAAATGFATALAVLLAIAGARHLRPARRRGAAAFLRPETGRLVFEGRALIASDGEARAAFAEIDAPGDDWDRATALLGPDFPMLDAAEPPSSLPSGALRAPGGPGLLRVSHDASVVTLALGRHSKVADPAEDPVPRLDPVELAVLRDATHLLPIPVWVQDADGTLSWVNRTYVETAAVLRPGSEPEVWPPEPLFDPDLLPAPGTAGASARLPLRTPFGATSRWYEIHARASGTHTVFAAINVDAEVRAEAQLRDFTQTLTKTFAHLTIGLAIFDQSRRLILSNPALGELTGLPGDFLASRPTLVGFLDRLRERRIVPEPKDYTSWRRKMAELEAASADGSYAETWSLPTGQTYRVTGRPHPDGAVILLIEDITAEISLTRRFRSELEMGQSVIDSLDEAIAVFTDSGVLAMTNAAYARLWGHEPDTGLSQISVADTTAIWLDRTAPTPAWGDFRDFARQGQSRAEWSADVILRDGRQLMCRFVPLSGGGTLAGFRPRRADDLRLHPDRRQTA